MWDFLLIFGLFYFLFNLAAMPRLIFETMNSSRQPGNRKVMISLGIFVVFALPYGLFPLVPFFWSSCEVCSSNSAAQALGCGFDQWLRCIKHWFTTFSLMFILVYALTGAAAITAGVWGVVKRG